MLCPRCNAQYPDHSNFCFHCGLQVNPNMPPQPNAPFNPNMPPMGNPMNMAPGMDDKKETYLFRLGMICFIVNMFWAFYRFIGTLLKSEIMYDMHYIMDYIQVLTYSMVLLFSFIYVKRPNYKTTLIVFFVVSVIFTVFSKMLNSYYY